MSISKIQELKETGKKVKKPEVYRSKAGRRRTHVFINDKILTELDLIVKGRNAKINSEKINRSDVMEDILAAVLNVKTGNAHFIDAVK